MKTKIIFVVGFFVLFFVLAFWFIQTPKTQNKGTLNETEALAIAKQRCIKGGETLSSGSYNNTTKTWWFDANLNATKPGCNPACVVSETTKTAEINWRCTGAIPPEQPQVVGGDSDIHGCKDSAGYSWCGTKQKCLRPWEETCDGATIPVSQKISCPPKKTGEQIACPMIYQPVCALVQVQCIKAPCPLRNQTFGNSCEACANSLITEYTEGSCVQ